ncbi:MAG: hypothetical protein KAU99_00625 [Thermoplasmata archaeon]|nr:hypothetical protein [Thermoplasmata archaeon]
MEEVIEVDDGTWEGTIEKDQKPAAVMFYSPTCAYCAQIEPYFADSQRIARTGSCSPS